MAKNKDDGLSDAERRKLDQALRAEAIRKKPDADALAKIRDKIKRKEK